MWQFSNAQLYGVKTGSRILERDDKDYAAKAKKTNFNRLSAMPKPQTPSKLRIPSKPQAPPIPQRSSLWVRFQHTPIDFTRPRTKKDSDNESFLSILRSSSDEEYRPLHENWTPTGHGQPGTSPGAPVPVYGMSLCPRKKWGLGRISRGGRGKVSYHHPYKDTIADLRHTSWFSWLFSFFWLYWWLGRQRWGWDIWGIDIAIGCRDHVSLLVDVSLPRDVR